MTASTRVCRVHIVGAPSAGKSTLARELARRLDVPYFDLDSIAFSDERWTLRPLDERLKRVSEIAGTETWVTEGGHLGWPDQLFRAADLIVWLDPPLTTLLVRHWHRHRHRGLGWLVRYGWGWQVGWYVKRYRGDLGPDRDAGISRASTREALTPYQSKVRRYRRNPSANEVLTGTGSVSADTAS